MPRNRAIILGVALLGLSVGAVFGQENPSLDTLRLGSRYLRWAPGQEGASPAAAGPSATAPAPIPIATPAPEARGISLPQWEVMAERCNPTLTQAAARVEAARAEGVQAGLYPNPRVGYLASEIGDEKQAGQQGAFVGQEIVTNGKLKLSRQVAEQAIVQAQWAWAVQRGRVINDVRRAFYEVLVAQRTVELTEQLLRVGREGVRAADALRNVKEASRFDGLQARIEADSAQITAEKARNRYAAAWRNLALLAGMPDVPPAPLLGELQDGLAQLSWEGELCRVLCESPTIAEARSGVARAEAALNHQNAERVPNVDVQLALQYDNATGDPIAGVQAGVPLPLFNRNQGNIRRAEAELAAARAEVRRVELELRQRLTAAFEQYQNARCQVEKYADQILPNAQTSLDLVAAGYRQGHFDYVTLLTAQRTFFQVNLAYIEAVRDLRTAAVAIEGNLLSDSLEQR
jgi:cobalt-zinc-cadmium efflux system outer membrane protein